MATNLGDTYYAVVNSYTTYNQYGTYDGDVEITLRAVSGGLWVATSAVTCIIGTNVDSSHIDAGGSRPGAFWLPQGTTQTFKLVGGDQLFLCSDQAVGSITVYTAWIAQTTA